MFFDLNLAYFETSETTEKPFYGGHVISHEML